MKQAMHADNQGRNQRANRMGLCGLVLMTLAVPSLLCSAAPAQSNPFAQQPMKDSSTSTFSGKSATSDWVQGKSGFDTRKTTDWTAGSTAFSVNTKLGAAPQHGGMPQIVSQAKAHKAQVDENATEEAGMLPTGLDSVQSGAQAASGKTKSAHGMHSASHSLERTWAATMASSAHGQQGSRQSPGGKQHGASPGMSRRKTSHRGEGHRGTSSDHGGSDSGSSFGSATNSSGSYSPSYGSHSSGSMDGETDGMNHHAPMD